MNPRRKNFLSTGTTSIVLIFVLLCLLTFSVLSVVSARADLNLSTKSADRTTEYYEAENEANDILLTVRNSLASHAGSPDFLSEVRSDLEGNSGITFSEENAPSYHVPINENQQLFVSLTLSAEPQENGDYYQIEAWKVENTHEWNNDTSVPVLNSDTMDELFSEE